MLGKLEQDQSNGGARLQQRGKTKSLNFPSGISMVRRIGPMAKRKMPIGRFPLQVSSRSTVG